MDGLDVVRPTKDVAYAGLRPTRAATLGPALTDFFTRHPDAAGLIPLWSAGELAFAHAVVTPYRSGRSHFVGQDALENGTVDGNLTPGHDGWLNRALSVMPNATNDTAVLVGQQRLLLPDGAHETDHWFPVTKSPLSAQGLDLLHAVNATAPLFAEPYALAQSLARSMNKKQAPKGGQADAQPGTYVAKRLTGASRIAGFSFGGWDTHNQQAKTMTDQLTSLTQVLTFMKTGLGRSCRITLVLAMTEFDRSAHENGTQGTDHGTGGMGIVSGGALKGGRLFGQWPGLSDANLLSERDVMPTADVRSYPVWALRTMFGLDAAGPQSTVFPGLDLGPNPGFLL